MNQITNIPDGWSKKSIDKLVLEGVLYKPMDGNHGNIHPKSSDYVKTGIPFIMACDLEDGSIDLNKCKYIRREQADKLQKGFSLEGDILLSHKATVGEVAIVKNLTTEYIMLTPQVTYYRVRDFNKLKAEYLYQYFLSNKFQSELAVASAGGTRSYIGITEQRKLNIIMPSFDEQSKIAIILTSWDDMIDLQAEKVEQLKQEKQSRLQTLLKPKNDWEEVKLGELINQRSLRNKNTEVFRVLSVSNKKGFVLPEEQFARTVASKDLSNYKIVKQGDYAYNPSRINVGSIARLDNYDIGIVSPMYVVVTPLEDKIDSEYFYQWISSYEAKEKIKRSASGSVRETVDYTAFSSLKISISKDVKEQKRIAKALKGYDELIELNQNKLNALKEQKKGLMQKLLTGEIRV